MTLRHSLWLGAAVAGVLVPTTALGAVSGTVYADYNSNGKRDGGGFSAGSSVTATDSGVPGVTVRAYDNAGTKVGETTTGADGTYSLPNWATGTVRVEFTTPGGYQSAFAGATSGSGVQFVSADASGVDYGIARPGDYCQDNPRLVTCILPAVNQMTAYPDQAGPVSMSSALVEQRFTDYGAADYDDVSSLMRGFTKEAVQSKVGSVFGVGADRGGNAYFGTYVKRHSPYGPAGAVNAIYRLDLNTKDVSTFVVLGSNALPAHSAQTSGAAWPAYSEDGLRSITSPSNPRYSDVYNKVGRAGLGDVDVSSDGSTLYAVEMTEAAPRLWSVPIEGSGQATSAGTPTSVAIPAPSTFNGVPCNGTWHPMGIGTTSTRLLVGGVCGADSTPNGSARTDAAAFVLERDASGGFSTIAAVRLDYPKGGSGSSASIVSATAADTGLWRNWHDGAPPNASQKSFPKPMLANIEVLADGGLALGFRDRFADQVKVGAVSYESTVGSEVTSDAGVAAAEVLRLCFTGSGYEREYNGTCGSTLGASFPAVLKNNLSDRPDSPLFYGASYKCTFPDPAWGNYCTSDFSPAHLYASIGGLATMPGSDQLWTTQYDIVYYDQQGVHSLGPCPQRSGWGTCGPAGRDAGAITGGVQLNGPEFYGNFGYSNPNDTLSPMYTFLKGNGLGDLELVCDAAPLQIGNRVWRDENANGIQDAGEPPIAGVTVRLFDAAGALVGTAVTDSRGTYYFNSNRSEPAAGDGDHIGGGLTVGAAHTVRLDNAADHAGRGALVGLTATKAEATTSSPGAQADQVNSKATMVGGYPQVAVGTRRAGFNDHAFDVGLRAPSASSASSTSTSKGLAVKVVTRRVVVWPKGSGTARLRYTSTGAAASSNIRTTVTIAPGFWVVSKGGARLRGRTLTWTRGSLAAGRSATWAFVVRDTTGRRRCARFPIVTTASDVQSAKRSAMVVCVRAAPVTG